MKLNELMYKNGVYVAVKPSTDTVEAILKFMVDHKIPNPLLGHDLHSTVLYSRSPVEVDAQEVITPPWIGHPTNFETWESPPNSRKPRKTNCLVLRFTCPELVKRHKEFIMQGGTHDYDDFRVHMTLSYDVGEDFVSVSLIDFPKTIKFDHEYTEPLNFNKTYV